MTTKSLRLATSFLLVYSVILSNAGCVTTAAQTTDNEPPSRETACEDAKLEGALLGLCRAYWEAHDCDVLSSPKNKKSCDKVASKFARLSGGRDIKDIFQSARRAIIGPGGGDVTLEGVGKVVFLAGAFKSDTAVRLQTSSTPEVAAAFDEFTTMFRPANRLAYGGV